jgi:hypothetical protein
MIFVPFCGLSGPHWHGVHRKFNQNLSVQKLKVRTNKTIVYQKAVFCKVRKEEPKCSLYNEKYCNSDA